MASADAKMAASEAAGEYSPSTYLSAAADLDMQAAAKREEIAELEKAGAQLRQK